MDFLPKGGGSRFVCIRNNNAELTREVQSFHVTNIAGQKVPVNSGNGRIMNHKTASSIVPSVKIFSPSQTKIYSQSPATLVPQRKILELH
jgi:hypothetical protein